MDSGGKSSPELDELRKRVKLLEAHVGALEKALAAMGWSPPPTFDAPAAFVPAATVAPPAAPASPPPSVPAWPPPPGVTQGPRPFPDASAGHAAPTQPSTAWVDELPTKPTLDIGSWLSQLGPGRILAIVGGGALLLGMAYLLSLAFSRGWIGPEARVLLGLVAVGFGLLPLGALLFDRARPTLAYVVVAVGLGTIELAYFASQLYDLVPAELAMVGALIAAVAAGTIAVRWNSQVIAGMGIVVVLAAPPILSAPANLTTAAFIGAVLVGVAYVSLRLNWEWLPWLALVLSAPQLFTWVASADVNPAIVAIALGGYWVLFAISAIGSVLLDEKRPLAGPITLMGTLAAFVSFAAYRAFDGDDVWLRGAFIGLLALANLAIGVFLVRRRGLNDDLAQSALALAIALSVVAVALLLDGAPVPIAWTLVMVVCAWVWTRFKLDSAGIAAAVVGGLTALHLLLFEYLVPFLRVPDGQAPDQVIPYADAEGLALLVFLAGLAAIGWLARDRFLQQLLAAGAAVLVAATVWFEAHNLADAYLAPTVMLGWAGLALGALAADRLWNRTWGSIAKPQPLPVAGLGIGLLAVLYLSGQYRLLDWAAPDKLPSTTPFTDEQSLVAMVVVIGIWLLALTRVDRVERLVTLSVSVVVIAALARQQLPLEWAVVVWCAMAIIIMALVPLRGREAAVGNFTAGGLLTIAAIATLIGVAPPSRLTVDPVTAALGGGPPNAATIALLALAAGLIVATWREMRTNGTQWLGIGALAAVVYMLSVGLVDAFAVRVPSVADLDEVGKQAQVALTIMWAVIGLALLGFGLRRDSLPARAGGLALLGLATIKGFLYDLTELDVAYRVLSLIGLGVLLLVGAYAYQRLRVKKPDEPEADGATPALEGDDRRGFTSRSGCTPRRPRPRRRAPVR